jgi:hypothetical protein
MTHKKVFHRALLLLALVIAYIAQSYAATSVSINNIKYTISDNSAIATGLTDESLTTNLIIPNSINYNGSSYPVTSISSYAFFGCSGLTSAIIGNAVTSIGTYAFSGCTGLTSVTIPGSVTSIGSSTFNNCTGLTKVNITDLAAWCVISFGDLWANPLYYSQHLYINDQEITKLNIPDSVISIRKYVFSGFTGLTYATIGNSVISIGDNAFSGCTGLNSVTMGNSVNSIGPAAFYGCTGLNSVTIGNAVTSIGAYAFSNCAGLTSATIPDSVTSIGDYAFSYCTGLKYASIGNSVTSIGMYAFYSCTGLNSVTLGNAVTSIGAYAFNNCSELNSVTLGDAVTSIGASAFVGCSNLVSINLPDSLTFLGESAFLRCYSLTGKLTIPKGLETIYAGSFRYTGYSVCEITGEKLINVINQSYYTFDKDVLGKVSTIIVPNSMASAYRDSDWGEYFDIISNSGITASVEITSPGNLATDIVTQTRKSPASINKLIITGGEMNEDDFRVIKDNMTACFELDLSAAICKNIPDDAFSGKIVLQTVVLPNSTVSIGKNVFANCPTLESVTISESGSLQTIGNNAFSDCNTLKTVKLGDKITSIGDKAFFNAYILSEFSLPTSLTTIGDNAFTNCAALKRVIIPSSVTYLGSSAFSGCSTLNEVVFDGCELAIGSSAFSGCSALPKVSLPKSIKSIGSSAFSKTGLLSVDLSELDALTKLNEETFSDCKKLESVAFPKNITSVGNEAFLNCSSLIDADMSETAVSDVGESAFSGCSKLASISLPATTKELKESAFSGCRKLQSLSITAVTPPTAHSTTFKSIPNETCALLIPTNAFYDYLLASYWGSFVDIKASFDIEIEGDEAELDYNMFNSEEEANEDVSSDNVGSSSHKQAKAKSNNLTNGISLFVPSSKTIRFHVTDNTAGGEISVLLNDVDVTEHMVNGYLILSNFDNVNKLKVKSLSGVKDVTTEDEINADTIVDVYNLSGVAVMHGVKMNSISDLNAGIYIVRSASAVKKIVIK